MKITKLFLMMILILAATTNVVAQEFVWDVDFLGFFDNREFKAPYQKPQTFFGSRLTPEVGIDFKESHSLRLGASWLEEFGSKKDRNIDMLLYYKYSGTNFYASFGTLPRKMLSREFPAVMYYDSLSYFNPFINGVLLQYQKRNNYIEAYCDWKSRQTDQNREIFTLASSALFNLKRVYAGYFLTVNHFAKTENASEDQNVVDNLMCNPYVGIDLSHLTFLDSLSIRGGIVMSANRNRGDNVWITPKGFLCEAELEWGWFGVKNTFYKGQNQLTFYDEFGPMLHNGDPFYRASMYDRLDICAYLLRRNSIECVAKSNIHFVGGRTQFQQQLILRVNFGQSIKFKKNR